MARKVFLCVLCDLLRLNVGAVANRRCTWRSLEKFFSARSAISAVKRILFPDTEAREDVREQILRCAAAADLFERRARVR